MRVFTLLLCAGCLFLSLRADPPDPGMMQDAEAAREKILKAADQIDLMETNSEATKTAVDTMKAQIAKLQDDNTALKQQLADLQAALDKAEAARAQERQTLLDEVAKLVASGKTGAKLIPKKKEPATETPLKVPETVAKTPDTDANTAASPPPSKHDAATASDSTSDGNAAPATTSIASTTGGDPAPAKPQKGYYHVVAPGETLTLICTAYREQGMKVTVGAIQKANGLTDKSVLKVGQKLFIPKPRP